MSQQDHDTSRDFDSHVVETNGERGIFREHSRRLRNRHISRHSRKLKSLYGRNPVPTFGPKAQLLQDTTLTVHDPTSLKLTWLSRPQTVFVIKKPEDSAAAELLKTIAQYLLTDLKMNVIVEESLLKDSSLINDAEFLAALKPNLQIFNAATCQNNIDLIVTLGGDGTLLHTSSLFQRSVPPLMSFNLGSLGFLTPFLSDHAKDSIDDALNGSLGVLLRNRLKCVVCRSAVQSEPVTDAADEEAVTLFPSLSGVKVTRTVLNEVVFNRGPSPYLSSIDLFVEGRHVTTVQGDGLIISTPTGSTAYAAAAGSSMLHPSVPAILVTPICPHSLSFRPIILPAGVDITVAVSPGARSTAWASFDGRHTEEIRNGDSVHITTSIYPLPSLCATDQLHDWFASLEQCLNWNERKTQKPLPSRPTEVRDQQDASSLAKNRLPAQ